MRISFHGAAREVTGSCHLIETTAGRVLMDCGMIQGGKERHERNRAPFPFDPASIDVVLLSHAHIDHCGRLPLLVRDGFTGPIYATAASVALAKILLADSAHIHEEDARWTIKRLKKRGKDASGITPLYTADDAAAALRLFVETEFDRWKHLDGIGRVRFAMAGHILGASIVELEIDDGDDCRHLTFSGDLGVDGARLLSRPAPVEAAEVMILESTYGDRDRDAAEDPTELLYDIVSRTASKGGKVVVPSFAVGRTQEILARLNDLVESGRLQGIPVFVDSPMAVEATHVFTRFPEAYSKEARRLYCSGDKPLQFEGLRLVTSVDESKAINESRYPAVIISASGMCTAGRVKHHLKHNISDPRSTVLFVGYQARGTLGHVIQSGIDPVRIFGDWYPVRARIESIRGFSAHADRSGLLDWFSSLGAVPKRTFVVHGEAKAAAALGRALRDEHSADVVVPELGDGFQLD